MTLCAPFLDGLRLPFSLHGTCFLVVWMHLLEVLVWVMSLSSIADCPVRMALRMVRMALRMAPA